MAFMYGLYELNVFSYTGNAEVCMLNVNPSSKTTFKIET